MELYIFSFLYSRFLLTDIHFSQFLLTRELMYLPQNHNSLYSSKCLTLYILLGQCFQICDTSFQCISFLFGGYGFSNIVNNPLYHMSLFCCSQNICGSKLVI